MKITASATMTISSGMQFYIIRHDHVLMGVSLSARSDYNFVRQDGKCIPVGPEPIPAGVCMDQNQMYKGSSGYRRIPGNTCDRERGLKKDEPIEKKCSQGRS